MRDILLIGGMVLPTASAIIYVYSILHKRTLPHRMTYALLSLITGLSFVSLIASHDTSGVWLAAVSFGQCLLIFGLSLRFGMGGKDPFDILCMSICGVGIGAWWLTGESMIGLVASIIADFVAVLPTLRKAWRHPHTEIWSFYALDSVAAFLVVLAGPYTWRAGLFPVYLLFVNAFCAGIIIGRGRVVSRIKAG